jgi:quinol monooxygenase YgiN
MPDNFSVIIQFDAKPGQSQSLAAILDALITPSRAEAGCQRYDVFADLDEPSRFTVIEEWNLERQWSAHLEAPHVKTALAKLPELLTKPFTAQRLSPLRMNRT